MMKSGSTLEVVLQHVERAPLRSSLFHWLFEHYGDIVASVGRHRIEWTPLCETFRAHGLTDATGKPPTESTARQTWYRVRREIKRQQRPTADAATRDRFKPSQVSKGWMPPALAKGVTPAIPAQPVAAQTPRPVAPSQAAEQPGSLLTKPKTAEQLIAEVALKKPARERTPEERIAVLIAGQQDRSYS